MGNHLSSIARSSTAAVLAAVVTTAVAPPGAAAPRPPGQQDWPMFMHDARHSGLSAETALSTGNAAGLRPAWSAWTGAPINSSPAVVWDAALGRTVVYVADNSGLISALDAHDGSALWSRKTPAAVNSSPAVSRGVVYVGGSDHVLYALDARTGAVRCSRDLGGVVTSSPVVVDPDGTGQVVYVGQHGWSGNDDGGAVVALTAVGSPAGPACSVRWTFDAYGEPPGSHPEAGTWSPPAFAVSRTGRPLVVFGGSSRDGAVYAVDARTGQRVWRVQTAQLSRDQDVGAGPTVSAPGVNGFADGVVYVAGKDRIVYALDLPTGRTVWTFSITADSPRAGGATRSTAALVGDRLYLGYGQGVYALDARTGRKVWKTTDRGPSTSEVLGSPSVTGPATGRVVLVGDAAGTVYAFAASDGARRWSTRTGAHVFSSVVPVGGTVFAGSGDGFLHAYRLGISGRPDTAVTSPAPGALVPNPHGDVLVRGTAAGGGGVSSVSVQVRDARTGRWWSADAGTWSDVPVQQHAVLDGSGAARTGWRAAFRAPYAGGTFAVLARAVDATGGQDPEPALTTFSVSALGHPPETVLTAPSDGQALFFPSSGRTSVPVTVRGTASDPEGVHPGVASVRVLVENLDHEEYWCGPAGCAGAGEDSRFSPQEHWVRAVLDRPGATSTGWSLTFPSYDHPHRYQVEAYAVDADGHRDSSPAQVEHFCVNDPGVRSCY